MRLFHNFETSHKIQIFKTHAKNLPHKHSSYLMLGCLPSQVRKVFYKQTRYRILMVALGNDSPMGPQGTSSWSQDAVPRWASCMLHPISQSGPGLGGHQGTDMEGCYFSTNETRNRRATPQDPKDTEGREHSPQLIQAKPESNHVVLDSSLPSGPGTPSAWRPSSRSK